MPEQTSQKRELLERTRRQNLKGVLFLLFGLIFFIGVTASVITTIRSPHVSAATSSTINFQARLQSAAGGIVPDGNYNIEFKLYDASSGGTALWTETRENRNSQGVTVRNGYVSVSLGSVTAFPGTINWDQDLWLTMNIGGTTTGVPGYDGEMNPRLKLTATPYAFQAKSATQLQTLQGSYTGSLQFGSLTDNRSISLPDENGTICLQGSVNCGFLTTATANSSYIQLQASSPGSVQTGNFNISGVGIATTLQAATFDTASAATLNIGTTNATAINLNQNVNVAAGKTLTVNGASTFNHTNTQGMVINSDLSAGNRIDNLVTITQANNASYSSAESLLAVKNFDTDSTAAVIDVTQSASGGVGIQIGGPLSSSGTGILIGSSYTGGHALTISNLGNMTSGTGIKVNGDGSSVSAAFTGQYLVVNPTRTYSGTGSMTDTGEYLNVSRQLTNSGAGTFANTGNLVNLNSNCIVVSGACTDSGSILNLNQQAASATGTVLNIQNSGTGNMINLVNSSSTVVASFDAGGNLTAPTVNVTGGYKYNGTAGTTTTCSSGDILQNMVIQGGIVTGGNCAANGGGVAPTLQDVYNNSPIPATITLNGANNGLTIKDASTTVGGNLFAVQDNAGTASYLAVTTSGASVAGTFSATTAIQAPLLDTATAIALNIGTTNATGINLNQNVTVASGKTLTLAGGATAGRPVSPVEGTMYFDTTTKQLLTYANGKWQADRSASTKIVAASDSSQAAKDAADYVADGTADQTEINAALAAAAGGKVYLMEGTYVVNASISIPNNTTLAGAGAGTVVEWANVAGSNDVLVENTDQTTGTGVVVQDLRLNGRKDLNTSGTLRGIEFTNIGSGSGAGSRTGAYISNVVIYNFIDVGVYFYNSANSTVVNSTAYDNSSGFYFSGSSNNVMTGDTGRNNASYGITFADASQNNTVTSSSITANGQIGIFIAGSANNAISANNLFDNNTGIYVQTSTDNTITGNTISGSTLDGVILQTSANNNTVSGNSSSLNGNAGFNVSSSTGNNLSSNSAQGNTNYGIAVNTGDNNTLVGNNLKNNGTVQIFLNTANANSVTSNYVEGGTRGIQLQTNSTGNTIASNVAKNNSAYGIRLISTVTDNVISDNRVIDSGGSTANNGIEVNNASSNTVSGNKITDSSATTTNYAISVLNSASTSNYLADNTLGGGSINDVGTGTIYANQLNANGDFTFESSSTRLGLGTTAPAYMLDVAGDINTTTGYRFNGTAGATTNCTGGQVLQNQVVQGGIVTGGTCAVVGGGVTTIGAIDGGTYSANGASISGTTMYLQSASATQVGLVTTGNQTFAGAKTFNASGTALTVTNDVAVNGKIITQRIEHAGSGGTSYLYFGNSGGTVVYDPNEIDLTGSPVVVTAVGPGGTSLQLGANYLSSPNSVTNGGTFLGLNASSSGVGSAADFLNFQKGGTTKLKVLNDGSVDSASGFKYNGTAGATTSCTSGQLLQNATIQGGIVTGGSCVAPSAGSLSGSGTINTIAMFTASGTVGDSILTQSGTTIGVAGTLNATTLLQAPALDAATGVALNIGTTNATGINLNQNTTLASGKTLTVNGSSTFNLLASDALTVNADLSTGNRSTDAVVITQANNSTYSSSGSLLSVKNSDTNSTAPIVNISQSASGGIALQIGGPPSASGTGILIGSAYTGGHALTISNIGGMTSGTGIKLNGDAASTSSAFTGQYILVNPTRTYQGSGTITDTGNALNIARSLTNSGTGTFANTGNLVDLSSNCIVVSGSCTDSGSILNLNQQSAAATGTVLNIQNAGSGKALTVNGASVFQSTNTAALVIQNSSSVAVLTVDTQNLQVVVGTTTNGIVLSANGMQLKGTARNAKTIVLTAEYAGAVLDAGTGSNNTGTMTSGANTANRMNFYKWTTTQSPTPQTYDVVVQVPIPSDFDSWSGATPSITFNTYTTDLTNGKLTLGLYDTSGSATSCVEGTTSITPGSASTWATASPSCTGGTYVAGGYITLRVRMSAVNNSNAQIGNIVLNYLSKY